MIPRAFPVLTVLALLLVVGAPLEIATAQPAATQVEAIQVEATKYWIFFQDKQGPVGKVAPVEPNHLSDAALERRARRAQHQRPDLDAPLSASYLAALQNQGITPHVQSRWLNAVSAVLTPAQADAVKALPFVTRLRPVARIETVEDAQLRPLVEAMPLPDVRQRYRLDYGPSITQLELVNAVPLLEAGMNGAGVKLGIIDTGMGDLPSQHPVLQPIVSDGRFIASENFTGQDPATDGNRHGFSVLSVAAGYAPGQLIGPAYGVEVYHAQTEYAPTETNQEEDALVAGLEWMEAQGVDVVNISLGYSLFDAGQNSYTTADLDGDTGITTIAADLAVEMGMVVVSSAGNSGCTAGPESCWYYITMPADGDNVITVGAVNSGGTLVSFSSRGPTADGRIKPDVSAQGASVRLATSSLGYGNSNGTSFSSPMVAGIVALMLEANPELTPFDVRRILRETASQAEMPGNNLGWGIVDAEAAVAAATNFSTATQSYEQPTAIRLAAPYPNPFTNATRLLVSNAGTPQQARLTVYNVLGQIVHTAFDGVLPTGSHALRIDLNDAASGLYVYRLTTEQGVQTGTLVRL